MGFWAMRNGQISRWATPCRRFGVIRGNLAADEQIFTKFAVYMDSGTQKAALWSTCTPVKFKIGENPQTFFSVISQ